MSGAFVATCLWFVVANVIAMLPSRDQHWTAAFWLIACGVPILGWLTWVHGPVAGVVALAAGASVLRWPVVFFWRWLRRGVSAPQREPAE